MKFNHCLAALIVLATFVLTSCGDELSLDITETPSTNETTVSDAVLRFATIEDFESMKASDISKDYEGFELNSLRYECVDTINMRALLLNVEAQLTDVIGANVNVSFTAEVGPELVSVEYYPGGEIVPPHDNMVLAFYPHVERYRNYSDGSRVGPDMFYDLGHPIYASIVPEYSIGSWEPFVISKTSGVINYWAGSSINPEAYYYENGCQYVYKKNITEINVNAVVLYNGKSYTGQDFMAVELSVIPLTNSYYAQKIQEYEKNATNFYGITEYGWNEYRASRIYGDEYNEYLNMCKDVPDVSSSQFPIDTHDLRPGFYYEPNTIFSPNQALFTSRYMKDLWGEDYYLLSIDAYGCNEFYRQYLVIDGRIIHFNDIVNYKYLGESASVSRIEGGYQRRFVEEFSVYGINLKSMADLELLGIEGEQVLYEMTSYNEIENLDNQELNQLNSSTRSAASVKDSYERQDGKSIVIDKTLPPSINNISRTRTIYSKDK